MTVPAPEDPVAARAARRTRRLFQVLVELDHEPAGLAWPELWTRVTEAVPLTPDDLEKTSTGAPKGENVVRWYLTGLDKSGWFLSGVTPLRITVAGRQALRDYPNPEALAVAQDEGYKRWDRLRKPPTEPAALPLASEIVPRRPGERLLFRAADEVLGAGLRDGGSAFDPGRSVWSAENVAALHAAFVDHPDDSGDPFIEKLARQFAGASDDTILLAAEMLALLLLPVSDWKSDTKRHRVKDVLVMMRDPVHLSLLFNAAMDHSGFNAGVSFKSMLWRQLVSMIEVAQAWQELGAEARGLVWSDPWAWSDFLTSVSGATPTNRAELAYLRHPATFLPIISGPDKAAIRDAYSDEVDVLSGDLDRDLLAITLALQQRVGGPVEYYDTPFVERWRGGSEPAPTHRAWLVRGSSVRGVDLVSSWLDEAFVSLAASQLPALDLPAEPSTLRAAVDEGYGHLSYAKREEKIRDLRAFLISMRPDDLVLTTSGGRVHVGTVTGEAEQVDSEGGLANLRRAVDWADETAAHDFADLPAELASRLRGSGDVADLTEVIGSVEALLPPPPGPGPKPHPEPTPVSLRHLTVDESEALLVSPTWLDDLVDLLNAKRQVILYGPPGTGKTYLAQKVAAAVAGQNYRLVQFHPAYSYEDFFEGYRPVKSEGGQVAFALKPGPFRRIVDDALERPDEPFLLIIDEINRGNLASVFGELYFLLEYRDEAIRLLYAEDDATTFVLPKNVYLIGTMNTADRSIALVDTAMRRRFAFLSLHPDDPHLAGLLPTWLLRHDLPVAVADLWVELNRRIPDAEFKIGPSYLMSPAVGTDQGLELIWRTSILPLLEEFHYGDGTDVGKQYGLAALRAALDPASEPSPVVADLEANEPEHD